jgi:hypothetical protein
MFHNIATMQVNKSECKWNKFKICCVSCGFDSKIAVLSDERFLNETQNKISMVNKFHQNTFFQVINHKSIIIYSIREYTGLLESNWVENVKWNIKKLYPFLGGFQHIKEKSQSIRAWLLGRAKYKHCPWAL